MSRLSPIAVPSSFISIGTIFLPTRPMGVASSSLASGSCSTLRLRRPIIMRARTQKGQWS